MAEKRKAAAGVYLPPELIYDILSLLPVKSIGRFRCVCKHWLFLLSDRQFLKRQFRLQTTKKAIFTRNSSFTSIDFRNNNVNGSGPPVPIYETLNFTPCSSSNSNVRSFYIRGSCNGLLLLLINCNYDGSYYLSIVNPITHESRRLPPPLGNKKKNLLPWSSIFGFGYCSYTDDYVVVISLPVRFPRIGPGAYVLKRNKWEAVENFPKRIDHHGSVVVNGAFHSIGFERFGRIIYAFDLAAAADSCFRVLELPKGLKNDTINYFRLFVFCGCLSLVTEHKAYLDSPCAVDVWVMKEYGVRDSWTKYISFTPRSPGFSLTPLFFWNGDKSIVGLRLIGATLVFYYFIQSTSTVIQLIEEKGLLQDHIWTFTESLFSPNRSNEGTGNEV